VAASAAIAAIGAGFGIVFGAHKMAAARTAIATAAKNSYIINEIIFFHYGKDKFCESVYCFVKQRNFF
jgi:hypothetical protein